MSRAPALLASALIHLGLLGAFVAWPDRAEPPKPPPVPVKLVPPPPPDGAVEVSTAPEPSPEPPAAQPAPIPDPPAAQPPPQPSPPLPPPPAPSPPARPPPSRTPPPPAPQRPARPAVQRPTPQRPAPPAQRPAPAPRPSPPRPQPDAVDLSALGDRLARNAPQRPARPAGATPGQLAAARADLGARLQRLWRPNCGPDDALAVNVRVRFRLRDGRIQGSPELVGGRSDDSVVRAAQERALAAVRSAEPFDWLPEEMQNGDYQPSFNAQQACS